MCDVTEWLGEFQLSQSDLKIECDDKIFLTLIQTILDLETTSASLGLTEAEIESLIIDHTTNRARKLHMLWMWKRKNGSSATYLALVRALAQIHDHSTAKSVLQHVKQSSGEAPSSTSII